MIHARRRIPVFLIAAALTAAIAASAGAFSASRAAAPAGSIFKKGYDKCKLASVAAIGKAAGAQLAKGHFDGKTCTWSSADGAYVVLVDSHPPGYLEFMVPSIGKHAGGEQVKAVKVPGSSKAVIDTHSYANTHRYQKDLFAVYPQGVVQVSLDYATKLPDAALVAVTQLVTRP